MGGGASEEAEDKYYVFQYNTSRDEWSRLPRHPKIYFAMAQFTGHLITVGGERASRGVDITGKVYRFKEESQEWEEFLKPMPTARCLLTVAIHPVRHRRHWGGLLVSGMARLYHVPLWRCTAVNHLSGTLPTPCLHLIEPCLPSPSPAPATYWGELMLVTTLQPLSSVHLLSPSFRKPSHLLTSHPATHQSGRPSLTPH